MPTDPPLGNDEFADAHARLIRGDDELFKELLLFLGQRAAEVRKRYSLGVHDMDDIVAIAVSRIWLSRRTFDPAKGTLAQWAYVILRRAALDYLRKRRRRVPLGDLASAPAPHLESAREDARASAAVLAIRQIMQRLSQMDRAILNAYAANKGGSWATDLARELHASPGALRVRRYRLTQRIKAEMLRRGHGYLSSDEIADASR